mmetsp:Transcript_57132/g.68317  ORF Transcript_57132/g.68317 Transcript_57132/m.68317 type:complete len:122 (+) Transcript_57132:18-383(+)
MIQQSQRDITTITAHPPQSGWKIEALSSGYHSSKLYVLKKAKNHKLVRHIHATNKEHSVELAPHRRLSIYSGLYTNIDTDDGSFQTLNVLCTDNNNKCNITLVDILFSMCAKFKYLLSATG